MLKRIVTAVAATLLLAGISVALVAAPADAHILPTTTVALAVTDSEISATLTIPASDLELATGLSVETDAAAIAAYVGTHVSVTSQNQKWLTDVGTLSVGTTQQYGTAAFDEVTMPVTLTPTSGAVPRQFDLVYDVVLDRVATHTVIVSLQSDWAGGQVGSAREIGTIAENTATGDVDPLTIDLGDGSEWRGFVSLLTLGIQHIVEGTDHQLFLLTLLLPAPLLVVSRRWAGATTPKRAVRRIATITLAFTVGHSITLALGALGLPVPQQAIEALIAVSILVAAAHAIRPIFPGREAVIAGGFGLIHGLAFSATLSALDLSGWQLALSLLGFNIGIELMQLLIVALVLPPLYVLARTRGYPPLRVGASLLTGVAALGWLLDRIGMANPVAAFANGFVDFAPWVVVGLWITAGVALAVNHRRTHLPGLTLAGGRALASAETGSASTR